MNIGYDLGHSEVDLLNLRIVKECGCRLIKFIRGFGYVLEDGKRTVHVDRWNIIEEAKKLKKIHDIEKQLSYARDHRERRKLRSHLYFVDN